MSDGTIEAGPDATQDAIEKRVAPAEAGELEASQPSSESETAGGDPSDERERINAHTQGVSHKLATPIVLGNETIETLYIRRPKPGDLRGLKLYAFANAETDEVLTVLPRISTPHVPEEILAEQLNAVDLFGLADTVATFLARK